MASGSNTANGIGARTQEDLLKLVGYAEIVKAAGVSRSSIERAWRGPWDDDEPRLPKPGKIGSRSVWAAEAVNQWLLARAGWQTGMVTTLARVNVDDLDPEQLDDQARVLAAQAHSKRTGKPVDPASLSLHLTAQVTGKDFVAMETEEHRIRAKYLSRLRHDKAAVVAAVLLPQLRPALASAFAELREMLEDPDAMEVEFKLVSDFLTLFELTTRLEDHGIRPRAGQSLLQSLAEFDPKRAAIVSAWLFPALRSVLASVDRGDNSPFLDQSQIDDLIVTAMNDERWVEFEHAATTARASRDRLPKKPR